ncbi:flagellar brake protein [Aquibacillus saliphilus]|uniref:flagellar brake protein n=1 Tax=Aquibacillus saliphilus TaxID=1909422 RepID=UPI001CEFEF2A|nr:flagellar brake domain-containing protein [Aquibacillus saliphilus]
MIKIGTPLTLESSNDGDIIRYRCKVVEHEESNLLVDYPINELSKRTNIFPKGTRFHASFVGSDNSVYQFNTEILGKKNINIPTLVLEYSNSNLVRIQRREHVRIETAIDIAVHDPASDIEPFTSITQDISGGGLSLVLATGYEFKSGIPLDIWMVLPMDSGGYEYVHAESRVIRVIERPKGKKDLLSLKFDNISDKDRQSIIRYCFERQLKVRRKEFK